MFRAANGMKRLIVIDLGVDKESERQRYGQTSMWATGKDTGEKNVDSHYIGQGIFLILGTYSCYCPGSAE